MTAGHDTQRNWWGLFKFDGRGLPIPTYPPGHRTVFAGNWPTSGGWRG